MALLYRTIFALPRADLIGDVRDAFQSWVQSKGIDADIQSAGTYSGEGVEIAGAEASDAGLNAIRLALHEDRDAERWSTTVTAISNQDERVVWVDLERVTEDPYGRPPLVAVPRLVRDLLSAGDAHCGPTALVVEPTVVDEGTVDGLVAQLLDPDRVVPLVVV